VIAVFMNSFIDVSSALGAAILHTLYVFSVSVGGRGRGKAQAIA
jgi:C4-dicarboxylate transporter